MPLLVAWALAWAGAADAQIADPQALIAARRDQVRHDHGRRPADAPERAGR